MRIDQRCAALAIWGFVSLAASPVLAASGDAVDIPNMGDLADVCQGVYVEYPLGEECVEPDGTTIYCQYGNPYCQAIEPRPANPHAVTVVARPPVGGNTMAPPARTPAIPGSLSSPSTGGLAPPSNCQTNPNCG